MNYLILTPDGVGSTILQRILTMNLYLENVKVKNTHELLNGLSIVDGVAEKKWDPNYGQSLEEIKKILNESSPSTTLVSRMAKYHIDIRKDNNKDQKMFYDFLNQKYDYMIMCERKNIFEYAMSWSIRIKSGVLNVYNKEDRDKVLSVDSVDEEQFLKKCKEYVDYTYWVEENFPKVNKVTYEDMLTNSDDVLYKISGYKDSFVKNFGSTMKDIFKHEYDAFNYITKDQEQTALTKDQIKSLTKYRLLAKKLINEKIIVSMPLKNTTLKDKQAQIKNFNSCLDMFYTFAKNHNWIDQSTATFDFWNNENIC